MQEEELRKRAKTQQHTEGYSSATATTGIKESVVEISTNSGSNHHSNSQQKDHKTASWLYKGLVVKVVSKEADKGRLYKLKGRVLRLLGRDYHEAEVEMDHDGRLHRLHVRDLETTIPKVSQSVSTAVYVWEWQCKWTLCSAGLLFSKQASVTYTILVEWFLSYTVYSLSLIHI